MFGSIARQVSRSQRWQASTKQDEPMIDLVMKGDPEACTILAELLVLGVFIVACKLMK
jgi:hypothetical protein